MPATPETPSTACRDEIQAFICGKGIETFEELEIWDWEDLPGPIADFIQDQRGLKFNRESISCRTELENAFRNLQNVKVPRRRWT